MMFMCIMCGSGARHLAATTRRSLQLEADPVAWAQCKGLTLLKSQATIRTIGTNCMFKHIYIYIYGRFSFVPLPQHRCVNAT